MSEAPALRKVASQTQSFGSIHTLMTSRQPYMSEPIASKRVCFYKSGDAQFSGLPVVINKRTFKTFEALLDSLSKRVPLPFGVRTITTPRGQTTVRSLDQLHHGHSYICSDKRTVKPIDLERAQRKPPPWYHARPVSSRRLTREQPESGPGPLSTRRARRNEHAALLSTPKRLVVFRNGNPEVKHTLLLQKRTTRSFEALLDLVSEVMCFPVLKLHTPDGRRVDGLPALILCSGVLVAAGREPFKKGNYDVQKPSAPIWLPAKSVGRLHPVSRKKKSITSSTKSRPFSPFSERYIVNQINNSFAGSAYNYPSNPTGSIEMETSQVVESAAETDTIACLDGDGEEDIHMPTEDDIEKSFRVNQDGSMTVEMKVRLTIKEEETIHWTTTLCRSSVASQMKTVSEIHSNLDETLSDSIPADAGPVASEIILNWPEEHACLNESNETMEQGKTEQIIKEKETIHPLPSSPEWCKVQQKHSVGSSMKVTETEIQENVLGSYAYKEETSNGEMKQEHCMIRHCKSRPVPKPRSNVPSDLHTTSSNLQANTYKSAEIQQLRDSGEEVHETVLHIYEQQTCQENFFANTQLCMQGMGTYSASSGRPGSSDAVFPASSDKTLPTSSKDVETDPRVSSTYGSFKRQECLFQSDLNTVCKKQMSQEIRSKKSRMSSHVLESSEPRTISTAETTKRRKPVRVIVKKNHIFQITVPERKQKYNKNDALKEMKKIRTDIFSRAGTMRLTEHYRAKAVHRLLKRRNNPAYRQGSIPSTIHNPVQLMVESLNELSTEKKKSTTEMNPAQAGLLYRKLNETSTSLKKDLLYASANKSTLTRQTSMHEEQGFQRETQELSESISLPALHSSSSVFNEYVELWLQRSEHDQEQVQYPHPELQKNTTLLTPQEAQPSPKLSDKTCELWASEDKSKEDTICSVLPDNRFPRNQSLTNFSKEEKFLYIKESLPRNSSPKRNFSQEDTFLSERKDAFSKFATETKSPQSNAEEKTPLPLSVKNELWQKTISTEDGFLLNDNSAEKKTLQNVFQRQTSMARDVFVKSDNAASASTESSTEFPKLPSTLETIPVPRNTKTTDQLKDFISEKNDNSTLEKTSTSKDHVEQKPVSQTVSSEKAVLPNQPSVEKIPKNNTLTKASLFNNQNVEKNPISMKIISDKEPRHRYPSLTKLSESKMTFLGNTQFSSNATTTSKIQQNIIPNEDISTSETNICTSLRDDADSHIKPAEITALEAEKSYMVKMAVRPDMRHVLDELCHSIQSLREVTQQKQRSCLEKSNSMPDFSSNLTSTFGSSTRVFLAFLSIMTLKDGLANLNACRQAQNLSCSEALLMLQSLKEMAAIEDAEQLRFSLNAMQNSISIHLLQSWRSFQELSNKIRSHNVTPHSSISESYSGSHSEDEVIQGLMENLGVPDRVREELAALCSQEQESIRGNQVGGLEKLNESLSEVKVNGFTESSSKENTISIPDSLIEDVSVYVKSVIEKAVRAHLADCGISDFSLTHLLDAAKKQIKAVTDENVSLLEENQQIIGGRVIDPMKGMSDIEMVATTCKQHQQIEAKPQKSVKEYAAMKERRVCEDYDKYIMDERLKYPRLLHNDEEKVMDDRDIHEVRPTEKQLKIFETQSDSEGRLTTSEEEKYSIETEEDSCDEELMSFSEDQVCNELEDIQMTETTVSSIFQKNITAAPSRWQSEENMSQTVSGLHSKTDCVEKQIGQLEMQDNLFPVDVQSHVKEVITQHDTEQQQTIYDCRVINSEEEHVILEGPECYTIYQEQFLEEYGPGEAVNYEEKTVAEFISNLESDNLTEVSQISSKQEEMEEMEDPSKVQTQIKNEIDKHIQCASTKESQKTVKASKWSQMDLTTEPLSSSLAFSYDSRSSSLAQEPEGIVQVNRVRSIREMFLAKSDTKSHNRQRQLHSANSETSDYQAESTDSSGNRSQTSPETSSGEDENRQLAIAKGFVRRTIERLYGRGNSNSTGPEERRPLSASKGRSREGPGRTNVSTLASIHEARTRVKTDLSYYNAKSSFDVSSEPTQCITLNAQVRTEDAVLIDKGRWLICENQRICESSPELEESQRKLESVASLSAIPEQSTNNEDVPYSLFCPASPHSTLPSTELEELESSGSKFTYFRLPNASDSELEQEGRNADTPSKKEARLTPVSQPLISWPEKNSFLPAFNPPVVKRADNRVHPLLETITPPVVTQPARGMSAQKEVTRHSTDPDVLEMLFIFCGQHCPIL